MTEDEAAIVEVIEQETRAFLMRDFDGWARCWVHDPGIRRLGAVMGGLMEYQAGWDLQQDAVRRFYQRFPLANPGAAQAMRRANMSIRVAETMAWVSFDQYGASSEDPLVTVGLSHQIRVLEKHDGQWRIALAGHGDTSLAYYDFPVIRIDDGCRISWMNEAAAQELPGHPALTKSGAQLRGRFGPDDKRLRRTVSEVADLTIMERRPSLLHPRGRLADPVILTAGTADEQHIVWVSAQDGAMIVSFRDRSNERERLAYAADLYQLSPGQVRVAELVLEGHGMQGVADRLDITLSTAKTHLARIFDKTGVRSQSALVSRLLAVGPPR